MAVTFPASPANGDTFRFPNGWMYRWNGVAWVKISATPGRTARPRNYLLNAAMEFSDEYGYPTSSLSGTGVGDAYPAEQWRHRISVPSAVYSGGCYTPNGPPVGAGFYIGGQYGNGAVPGTSSFWLIEQSIEGTFFKDFGWGAAGAKAAVLRFWVQAAIGTWSIKISNSAADRAFIAQFLVPDNANWTEVSIPIPGDTTGTWLADTGIGARVSWCLYCGSDFNGVLGWQSGNKYNIAGQRSLLDADNSYFFMGAPGLYLDPDNTKAAPLWETPDLQETISACRRYFSKTVTGHGGPGTNAYNMWSIGQLGAPPRVAPALSGSNISNSGYPATVGTLRWEADAAGAVISEQRAVNATASSTFYSTLVTANGRL